MIEVEKIVHRTVTRYIIKGTDLPHRADGPAFIWVSGKKRMVLLWKVSQIRWSSN
jgi:hypothetical protein